MISVLYVDDEPFHRDLVKQYLEEDGEFFVDTLDSAKKAIASEKLPGYDAIISDYMMPGMDGITFLQQIRRSGNHVPFILFTGRGREEIVIQALNAGADFYLQKDMDPEPLFAELIHQLQAACRHSRAQHDLEESESRFRELFGAMKSGVAVYGAVENGADFVFQDLNAGAEQIDGITRDGVIGRRLTEVFPGIREFGILDVLARVWKTGQPEHFPVTRYRDDRIAGWRENYVYRLHSGEVVTIYDDITGRIEAEEALRESEKKYRTLFNMMSRGVFYQRTDGTLEDVNPAALQMLGLTREQFLGMDSYHPHWKIITEEGNLLTPEEHPSNIALRTGTSVRDRVLGVYVPGRDDYTWVRVTAEPQFLPGETSPYQVFVILDDITEKKRAEEAIETMVRSMIGTTGSHSFTKIQENLASWLGAECVMIGEIQPDGVTLRVASMLLDGKESGGQTCSLEGTACGNTARNGFCIFPDNVQKSFPEDQELARLNIRSFIGTPLIKSNGDLAGVLCILSRSPLEADRGTRRIIDIIATKAAAELERWRSEAALRESEERYRALVDHALEAIFIFDFSGTVLFANGAVATLLDAGDPRGLAGRSAFEFLAPESRADAASDFAQVRDGWDAYLARYKVITTTGQEKWVESIGKKIAYRGSPACITMLRDITGRMKAELALQDANRKLSLLNSITRHDIRNQILPLRAYLNFAKRTTDDPEKARMFIGKAERIVETIERQILFTKEYEDLGKSEPVWQDAGAGIALAAEDRDLAGVTLDYSRMQGVEILAAPLLQKVFFNLLDNSLRYGGEKLSTIRFSWHGNGEQMVIVCEDDGQGIPGSEKEVIFERGYGNNTGYGLFFIREVLEISGMTIRETGVPGGGARFEITVGKGDWRIADRPRDEPVRGT